jgi:hypothetical protein
MIFVSLIESFAPSSFSVKNIGLRMELRPFDQGNTLFSIVLS